MTGRASFGSLFAGIGGFDLGLENAGWEPVWQVEIDERCKRVLGQHWPGIERYDDVKTIEPESMEKADLICGGFPCQDLSVAGRKAGLEGSRSSLFWEVVRVAEVLSPRWIVLENVPGLLSSKKGADFATVLESLGELGYGLCWRVLDSQYFGLAQRRKRVFIIGHLGGSCPPEILFEPGGGPGNPQTFQEPEKTYPRTTEEGAGADSLMSIAYALTKRTHKGGDPTTDTYIPSKRGVRRLTPTECERLQGFPDGWTGCLSDTRRYAALGNAVSVPVAEWIGKNILRAMEERNI